MLAAKTCRPLLVLAVLSACGSGGTGDGKSETASAEDARAAVVPASGECVVIPSVSGEVFRYGKSFSVPDRRWTVKTEDLRIDLDGHKSRVVRVPRLAELGPRKNFIGMSWDLYIESSGCARKLGSYTGFKTPSVLRESHHGLYDLEVLAQYALNRDGKDVQAVTTYKFDGAVYQGSAPWLRD